MDLFRRLKKGKEDTDSALGLDDALTDLPPDEPEMVEVPPLAPPPEIKRLFENLQSLPQAG